MLEIVTRIPGGVPGLTVAGDDDVVGLIESAQLVLQSAHGMFAAGSGESAHRSPGSGQHSLARRLGWKTARGVIAAKAGISFGEAARAVSVGEAIRPNVAASGEDLPADRPHIAAAVLAGDLILSIAQLIDRTLDQLTTRLDRDLLTALERDLVAEFGSGRHSVAEFTAHCLQTVEMFDPSGPRTATTPSAAKPPCTRPGCRTGCSASSPSSTPRPPRSTGPPSAHAPTTNGLRPPGGQHRDRPPGPRTAKQPTDMEAKVAAFIGIMRDAVRCENGPQAGIDTTILVRISLESLLSGIGSATIDGMPKPISASAARRLAAEADIIPQVLDGKSQRP